MSFNRLNYDTCQYKQTLAESVGPGHYSLNTPPVSCDPCYPSDPKIRLQRSGASIDTSRPLIDIDSELQNIVRPHSKCPSRKFIPQCSGYDAKGYPCGQGVTNSCTPCEANSNSASAAPSTEEEQARGGAGTLHPGSKCPDQYAGTLRHYKDCSLKEDDTRLSNPACNLRGTGINRWEWLCMNPQDRVEIPFDHNISNRLVVKDNHRPCVQYPSKPTAQPVAGAAPNCMYTTPTCGVPTNPPSVQWRSCSSLNEY